MSAGWMTSKGGGWGWRLVTGATQGGLTCPTRSGLVLHPALCPEHHGTGLTAAPPTRDSSRPQEKDLRHRIQDSRHREPGSSSHPFSHPGAKCLHTPIHSHAHPQSSLARWRQRWVPGPQKATPSFVHKFFLLSSSPPRNS